MPAPTPLEYLEYDEQDEDNLFGSEPEEVQPIAGPSNPPSLPAYNSARPLGGRAETLIPAPSSSSSKGKERATAKDPQDRLDELRFMRLPKRVKPASGAGVMSLKDMTMSSASTMIEEMGMPDEGVVIRQNSTRIWDIGDLEYRVIADFINELPLEQLTEVEANSPVCVLLQAVYCCCS